MKNKYYTPIIEEFHVGFEYEILVGLSDWQTIQFKNEMWKSLSGKHVTKYLKNEYIRVKYLDKGDIESLGFKQTGGKLAKDVQDIFSKYENGRFIEYKMTFTYGGKYLEIDKIMDDDTLELFKGVIKNKSELIKLLKQLNIQ